jgi:probable HAF family extracellular repeat protein
MSLSGLQSRAKLAVVRLRAASALSVFLLAACGVESPTAPTGSELAPGSAARALTGATSTPVFPSRPAGEIQVVGDARGLNALGQVTGAEFGFIPLDGDFKPYRWTAEAGLVKLTGCCDTQYGTDINDAGTVVGIAQTSALVGTRGFVAVGISMVPLSILPGASAELNAGAVAINDVGQIVGYSPSAGGGQHAVLWSAEGVIQDLGTLGGTNSKAIDINASGQVIGSSQIAGDAATHFFLGSSGTGMQDLNTLLGPVTDVVEINDAGQIIGTYTATGGVSHAFLYTPGSGLLDLGTLGGTMSAPTGLNENGQVVGSSTTSGGATHAFLWTSTDGMEDITAVTGIADVRRLNDNLQTLTGAVAPTAQVNLATATNPRLVQLSFSASGGDAAPVAAFTWTCERNRCSFDASTSTDDHGITSYAWDLDRDHGGGKSNGVKVRTNYGKGGTHEVTLTVTDTKGQTSSVTHVITL